MKKAEKSKIAIRVICLVLAVLLAFGTIYAGIIAVL